MLDDEKALVMSNLESILTLYCKSRATSYDRDAGWMHIVRILVSLKFSKAELYNCFYAIATKYIPRYIVSCYVFCCRTALTFKFFKYENNCLLMFLRNFALMCVFLDAAFHCKINHVLLAFHGTLLAVGH